MRMFEVWGSTDAGLTRIARFRELDDALRWVEDERHGRSLAVRTPDGAWYRDPATGRSILGPDTPGPPHIAIGSARMESAPAMPMPLQTLRPRRPRRPRPPRRKRRET